MERKVNHGFKIITAMLVIVVCLFSRQTWSVDSLAATLEFDQKKYTGNQGNIIDATLLYNGVDVTADAYYWYYPNYESSDKSIVAVDNYGNPRFLCLNEGKAVITATYDGMTAKCTVNVKANKLSVNKTDVSVYVGETIELKVTGGKTPVSQYVEAYDLEYNKLYSAYDLFSAETDCNTGVYKIRTTKEGEYYLNLVRVNNEGVYYSKMVHVKVEKCGPVSNNLAVAIGKSTSVEFENSEYVSMKVKSWTDQDGYTRYADGSSYYNYWGDNEDVHNQLVLTNYGDDYSFYDGYSYIYSENGYDDWYDQKLIYTYYEVAWTYYFYKEAGVYFCIMENNTTYETVRIDNYTFENGAMVTKLPEEKPEVTSTPVVTATPTPTPVPTAVPTSYPTSTPAPTSIPVVTATPIPSYSNSDYPAKINENTLKITGKYEGNMTIEVTYKTPDGNLVTADVTIYVTNPQYQAFDSYLWVNDSYRANYTGTSNYSEIKIKSSDKAIVEIDENNNIVPKAAGTCKLTITIDGIKFTDNVKVIKVNVDDSNMLLVVGKSESRKVTGLPSDLKATYMSSDKSIVTVSKAGKIKATKKIGAATVTITIGTKNFTFVVTVGEKLGVNAAKAAGDKVGKSIYSQEKRMQEGYYDCSSLVWRSYREAGVCMKNDSYAPTAADLGKYLEEKGCAIANSAISVENLQPGDLLFSTSGGNNGRYLNIDHVAMFYGFSEGYYYWYYDEDYSEFSGTIVEAGSGGVHYSGYPGYGNTVIIARPSLLYNK